MTGGLRVGLSARLAKQRRRPTWAACRSAEIEELWHAPAAALRGPVRLAGGPLASARRRRRPAASGPVMLAQAIDEAVDFAKLDPADYAAEWKWDGIRVQAVNEGGVRRLYTRTGDDISARLPRRGRRAGLRGRDRRRAAGAARRPGRALRRPAAAAEPQDRRRQADGRLPGRRSAPTTSWPTGAEDTARPAVRRAPQAAGGLRRAPGERRASTCRRCSRSRAGTSWPPCAPIRRPAIRRSPRA